ncbi:putative protein phosphatase 2C 42 [Hibiscus syriacus]|uniref:protein-serine/threonine phosphatase n=1 Tax=Hibiscus syriacus TaxID=106335 RepID=A0A6A2XLR9_HIBSY|nr:putative protein phosphatase 2C 42 [Hibiscus syriacus]
MNLFSVCWSPFGNEVENHETNGVLGGGGSSGGSREGKDGFLWFRDIGKYGSGEFSMAVIQANQALEDQSQIESGQFGTFVGIYDGHGGPEAARYVCDHLFNNFREIAAESEGVVTAETIQRAFNKRKKGLRPWCRSYGKVGNTGEIAAIQLSTEHNANIEAIRHELKDLHPNDPQIVVLKHGVWRVKGIIQVSRSIGDVYMKHARNEKAVAIVHSHPRAGSAKRLSRLPTRSSEKTRNEIFRSTEDRQEGSTPFPRRITVIVLFFNHDLISRGAVQDPLVSIRSALEHR